MAKQTINVGTSANDGTGDTLRASQQKAVNNFNDLYDDGGANITVNNPVTSTETTLDVALADLVGGGGATPTLAEVTTEGNETTDNIIVRDGDWTLNVGFDVYGEPRVTMVHDVYGEKGIYVPQGLQLNSIVEPTVSSQIEILAERTNYIGIKAQNEDLINAGNNLSTTLTFPLTSSIDQITVSRDFVFPDKPEGTYTLATTDDVGGSQTLAQTLVNGNITDGTNISISDGDAVILDNTSKLKKGTTNAGLGGNNGIAFKCSLDYEFKWEAGTLYIMEQDGFTIRESRYNFANNPTVTDDDTKGYVSGSRWIRDSGRTFRCDDATTGSAIWVEITPIVDLGYTASPTNGIVTADTGADATLPLADGTNAGLLKPADFTQLSTLATDLGNKQVTLTETNFGAFANGLTNKATPLDADLINIVDTADTNKQKKVTFTNVKAFLKTYFDTVYQAILTASNLHTFVDGLTAMTTPVDADRMIIVDNSASLAKKITWANIKATLKTYFDTLYATTAQVDLRTRELLQDFTAYTTTGVLTEQIISNQAITASDMKINSWLNFISTFDRTGTTNATVSIYLNTTSNSLSGAVKIAMATITSTQSLPCFKRDFSINASSVLRGVLFSANAVTDEIATQAQSTTTLTLGSAYYLITSVSLNNVADTVTQRAINLKSSK